MTLNPIPVCLLLSKLKLLAVTQNTAGLRIVNDIFRKYGQP